jgi:histidine decarboxylase
MGKAVNKSKEEHAGELYNRLHRDVGHVLGYPATKILDFSPLYRFLEFPINNIGDPFSSTGYFRLNTHDVERDVIQWFAKILNANKLHHEDDSVWGYVTCGGTEGNMYGLYLARELLPDGVVYYSGDTHYSVAKILRIANIRSTMVKSCADGEMDYDDLAAALKRNQDAPPIIFANIGTTMRGAIDDIDAINERLKDAAITRYYIHADAALSGMILPFVDRPQPFDFRAGIDSISISGHKFPGMPMPCGVVLARRSLVDRVAQSVEYIGTKDTTILGSRNGVTPIFLHHLIQTIGEAGFREMVQGCFNVADYAIRKFSSKNMNAWRHKNSITVVFPRINEPVLQKWQIALQGTDAHLITMPHITTKVIDDFIEELSA